MATNALYDQWKDAMLDYVADPENRRLKGRVDRIEDEIIRRIQEAGSRSPAQAVAR